MAVTGRRSERHSERAAYRPTVRDPHERFDIPEDRFPPGTEVAWKAVSIGGMQNPRFLDNLIGGWQPVKAEDWPEFSGVGGIEIPQSIIDGGYYKPPQPDAAVVKEGLMLMQRPIELSDKARANQAHKASEIQEVQFKRLFGKSRREVGRDRTFYRAKGQQQIHLDPEDED